VYSYTQYPYNRMTGIPDRYRYLGPTEVGQDVGDIALLVSELTDHYGLGMVAEAAGIEGGAKLRTGAAELLAGVADDVGVDLEAIETGQTWLRLQQHPYDRLAETGQAWAKVQKAASALHKGASKMLATASKNLALVFTIGAVYAAHDWLTADKQAKLQAQRQEAEFIRENWKAMEPGERKAAAKAFLGRSGAIPGINTVLIVGGVIVGLFLLTKLAK